MLSEKIRFTLAIYGIIGTISLFLLVVSGTLDGLHEDNKVLIAVFLMWPWPILLADIHGEQGIKRNEH